MWSPAPSDRSQQYATRTWVVPAGTSKGTNTKLPCCEAAKPPDMAWSGSRRPHVAGASAPAAGGPIRPIAAAATAEQTGTGNDLALKLDYANKEPGAYPINLVTYEIVCSKGKDPQTQANIKAFLTFFASEEAQKAIEEIGYAPAPPDGGGAYRARIAELVSTGRSFVRVDAGPTGPEVVFKAELGAVSPKVVQVQGVWVPPHRRGEGLSEPGMAAVVEASRADGVQHVSLYVNDYNARALAAPLSRLVATTSRLRSAGRGRMGRAGASPSWRQAPSPRAAAIAATSREYQRSAAGSLVRRNAPFGSVRRSRPLTVVAPMMSPPRRLAAARRSVGTKPRLTSTVKPASVTNGVITQKPGPRSVTACTSVSRSLR